MKKILFLFSLILLGISCESTPPTETELYVYLDFTEGQDYGSRFAEDIEQYTELLNLTEEGSSNFGKVKIFPLYDVASARSKTVKLKAGKGEFEKNVLLRKKDIEKFQTQLLQTLEEMNAEYTGKELNSSHIFEPMCKGIRKLNKSEADRKVILMYSDMLENSDIANFHSKSGSSKKWLERFDAACDPEDVSDLEMFVVYPVDKKNDAKITKAADFWANYFADKGMDEDAFHYDTGIDL